MFAQLCAKTVMLAIALGMAFFGVGLLGLALATSLIDLFGPAGAYAVTGAVLLLPPLFWGLARLIFRPKPKPPSGFSAVLLAALANRAPWAAVAGAGLSGLANMFLNRNRSGK